MKAIQLFRVRVLKVCMREKEAALLYRLLDLQTPCCQSAQQSVPWGYAFLQPSGGGGGGGITTKQMQRAAGQFMCVCVLYVCTPVDSSYCASAYLHMRVFVSCV